MSTLPCSSVPSSQLTSKNTTSVDGSQSTRRVGGKHDARTETEDERSNEETNFASPECSEWVAQQRAKEAASLVRRDDRRRDVGELLLGLFEEAWWAESRVSSRARRKWAASPSSPNSCLKLSRLMEVPMNAESSAEHSCQILPGRQTLASPHIQSSRE
jgi:hypothetical protein